MMPQDVLAFFSRASSHGGRMLREVPAQRGHEAVRPELGEVLRNGGLRHADDLGEIADANLSELVEHVEEPQTRGLRDDAQNRTA